MYIKEDVVLINLRVFEILMFIFICIFLTENEHRGVRGTLGKCQSSEDRKKGLSEFYNWRR